MYEFTEDCLIGIAEIDDEHRRLFQMINEALTLTAETNDLAAAAERLVTELRTYAATHFAHEEAYMEKIHDPELALQKQQHIAFTNKVNNFSVNTSSTDATLDSLRELMEYLVRWLYRHILSSDILIGKIPAKEEDPFAFSDKYKTGVAMIDEEHRRLFEIISDTNDVIHAELMHDKYDEIMRLLSELREYTESHFGDEEAYMERISYPLIGAQKRAHTAFVERLVEIDLSELDEMDDHQQEYLQELIDFLLGWLINHILGSDKKIGLYAAENHLPMD